MTLESKLKEIKEHWIHVEERNKVPWDNLDELQTFLGDLNSARQDVPMLLEVVEFLIVSIAELDPKPPGILEVIEPYLENILEKHYGK